MGRGLSPLQKEILEVLKCEEAKFKEDKNKYKQWKVDAGYIAGTLYPNLAKYHSRGSYYTDVDYNKQWIVQRALKSLEKRGLVYRAAFGEKPLRWRLGQPTEPRPDWDHMYVRCPHCGFSSEVDGVRVKLEPELVE